MAAKDLQKKSKSPQKRKDNPDAPTRSGNAMSKRPKLVAGAKTSSKPPSKDSKKKPFKQSKSNVGEDKKAFAGKKPYSKPDSKESTKKPFKKFKSNDGDENKAPMTKLERRKHAKELADARKMRRKHYYDIEQELARLSEKIRIRKRKEDDKTKFAEERSKLVGEAMQKVKGKIHEIACSHVCSRVLQYCVKYGSQAERNAMLEEILPHLFSLSTKTYAAFLIRKMLKYASKKQLATVISAFHGHVASLLRHKEGSVVIERAYQLGNAAQKHALLIESYSPELQIFKDLVTTKESKLTDIMSKLNLPKASVTRHMTSVIQPILEKGLVKHSIIHKVLIEYLSIADKTSAMDVIQQLSGTLLVKMIKTKDGSKIGMLCVKLGSAKERKKIVKGMKGRVQKIAEDQFGTMVLVEILSTVDDTKLVTKIVINELKEITNTLVLNKFGRRLFLQLLNPNSPRYFSPDYLASFDLSVPSLSSKEEESNEDKTESEANRSSDPGESHDIVEGGKKDPLVRRQELLVKSGLAEKLIDVCIEDAGKLLRSNIGKDMIYEVVTGGADGILNSALGEKLNALNEAIASLAAEPKLEGSKDEHVLENFHSSWVIRKLILDCPAFATALWNGALKGSCEIWAAGHSSKVLTAYLSSSDPKVKNLASKKLQGLIDDGLLKIPEKKSTVTTKV